MSKTSMYEYVHAASCESFHTIQQSATTTPPTSLATPAKVLAGGNSLLERWRSSSKAFRHRPLASFRRHCLPNSPCCCCVVVQATTGCIAPGVVYRLQAIDRVDRRKGCRNRKRRESYISRVFLSTSGKPKQDCLSPTL